MATTDVVQLLKNAIVAIANESVALQALCGRNTADLMVPWNDLGTLDKLSNDAQPPVLAYQVVGADEIGGGGDNRIITVQLTAFAQDDRERDPAEVVSGIMEVLETLFTPAVLAMQGVDGYVRKRTRREVPDDGDGARNEQRSDIDITFWITKS